MPRPSHAPAPSHRTGSHAGTPRSRSRTRRLAPIGAVSLGAVLLLSACAGPEQGAAAAAPELGPVPDAATALADESAELAELYEKAVAEGGTLTVWAGGDAPNQQDALVDAFEKRFPGVDLDLTVDLSKVHDERINEQLAEGRVEPDVAMLQTTFDFDDWKERGELREFTPLGAEHQLPGYADEDGAYLTAMMLGFLPSYAQDEVETMPTGYGDFLDEQYDGRLALTPPHDDDAVLYVYDRIRETYGDGFLAELRDQHPEWVRGTAAPAAMVGAEGQKAIGNLTAYATAEGDPSTAFIPAEDPFLVWTQRAAVFDKADNPAAGELFLAYVASAEFQSVQPGWRTRDDLAEPAGLKPLSEYPNTDPADFVEWMADRDHVAEVRAEMEEVFGPVTGESPLTDPRLLRILGIGS
ncbi:ABC transporter substrate-binding protein [Mycetocola reblochoni]|uniref:ABC-type Fe3+ transport system, periplasmic component n=2 Tax=Mycetocola reblochoni TaxID=331618 RepID=A0A1R4JW76_9MICO|nr:ABC transporter substrate-binding protein [Mycetocola reblochoni]SJN36266.1 ABC-type Fe3+ transport system, periplasmic component [Mycetocola reblochoni REB411]